ncbi:MAG: DUF2101 family protein [Candidatus Altiarchaeota archaeon]|nr:DUF2101 family protein [Candidatus Altiarchaeota archaeon]
MNPLSKFEFLVLVFLLLVLFSALVNPLFLFLAFLVFFLQYKYVEGEVRREYPEDWKKYLLTFTFYELMVSIMVFGISYSLFAGKSGSLLDLGRIYSAFFVIFAVFIIIAASMMFLRRRYTFGTVLFYKDEWVGVAVKGDLFSKIREGNYAVENPKKTKVTKGDRVRVRVEKKRFSGTFPSLLEEVRK